MIEVVAGIDIGGTNTLIGLVDRSGNCLQQKKLQTLHYQTFDEFTGAMAKAINNAIGDTGTAIKLTGIGIGAPNGNYHTGCIEFAVNLPWKDTLPLADLMSQHCRVPVKVTNDANAAAMGEMIFGAAKSMKDFIMITLGTGLGAGIVIDGKVVYGHDGNAGELGHVIVEPGGRLCGCGRQGCLETIVSATGITRTVKLMLEDTTRSSKLREIHPDNLNSKTIYEAAVAGDAVALEAFDLTCRFLGRSLADFVAFSSPEAIILFGGLAQAKEFILEPVRTYLEANLLKVYKNKVKLILSQLPENDAAILGAAALAWE
ncbi:MAG: ROK family protein [Bacteroidales bacterium]